MGTRDWDAATYDRISGPQQAWAREQLEPRLRAVLEQVGNGSDTPDALRAVCGQGLAEVLCALSELELCGLLRRGRGGRYVPCA